MTFKPVKQTASNCKTVAITNIDKYFAGAYGLAFFPLHKQKKSVISTRELAKRHQSLQGELLEMRQVEEILQEIGYQTAVKNIGSETEFQTSVTQALDSGHLIFACFAVDFNGLPLQSSAEDREHAAVIYAHQDGEIKMAHWGGNFQTSMKSFFGSNQALVEQRQPEFYLNIKSTSPLRKYGLVDSSYYGSRQSIVPQPNSGFKAKLLWVKPKSPEEFTWIRFKLILEKITSNLKDTHLLKSLSDAKTPSEFNVLLARYQQMHTANFVWRLLKMLVGSLLILMVLPVFVSWLMNQSIIDGFFKDDAHETFQQLGDYLPQIARMN